MYREVRKPELLVYDHDSDDEFHPDGFHVTVRFDEEGSQTRITIVMLFPTAEQKNEVVEKYGAVEGLNQTMGRLADYLASGIQAK